MQTVDRITVSGLAKRYGRQRALIAVDLTLESGRLCAVLGHNGAGKSTLLGILSTLIRPTAGTVQFHAGQAVLSSGAELRRQIGLLADASLLYGSLTAVENLAFFAGLYGLRAPAQRIEALLSEVGLPADEHHRPTAGFSRGMLQRLALCRALLHDPRVLLLDEPFNGLDQAGARALSESLARAKTEQRLVLIVTHDLASIAGLCDHVVVLAQGRIAHQAHRPVGFSHDELKDLYHRHSA